MPIVFYSIQDDDAHYRDFLRAGILTHFVRAKIELSAAGHAVAPARDAIAGRSFIDPHIASRVQEVRRRDRDDPMALLEPNEQAVARLLGEGLTNEQIAPGWASGTNARSAGWPARSTPRGT